MSRAKLMRFRPSLFSLIFPLTFACTAPVAQSPVRQKTGVPQYTYEVVKTYPHDSKAYTQGLVWIPDGFYESTGQYGSSDLRQVRLADGRPTKLVPVESKYFAEGLALLNGQLFQLTWEDQIGFVYDSATFKRTGSFRYDGEGWGLATDGKSLILSDGTNKTSPGSFVSSVAAIRAPLGFRARSSALGERGTGMRSGRKTHSSDFVYHRTESCFRLNRRRPAPPVW